MFKVVAQANSADNLNQITPVVEIGQIVMKVIFGIELEPSRDDQTARSNVVASPVSDVSKRSGGSQRERLNRVRKYRRHILLRRLPDGPQLTTDETGRCHGASLRGPQLDQHAMKSVNVPPALPRHTAVAHRGGPPGIRRCELPQQL